MQNKLKTSSRRAGQTRGYKITSISKAPYQPSVCNPNTSRKTPIHNAKYGENKNIISYKNYRDSMKMLNPSYQKLNNMKLNGMNK